MRSATRLAILCPRSYATEARRVPRSLLRSGKKVLSLDHFLQRQRVLSFWREIVRATSKIRVEDTRAEMKTFARDEFERNRNVQDMAHIRYLVSMGREQFKSMQRYVDEMGRR